MQARGRDAEAPDYHRRRMHLSAGSCIPNRTGRGDAGCSEYVATRRKARKSRMASRPSASRISRVRRSACNALLL